MLLQLDALVTLVVMTVTSASVTQASRGSDARKDPEVRQSVGYVHAPQQGTKTMTTTPMAGTISVDRL